MKESLHVLFGLLLMATPVAAQAQFYYSENANVGSINNTSCITITGYYGPDGEVTIPSTIDGLTVTTIGENAFLEEVGVINLTIPASVTSIGANAFSDSGLTGLTIPGSVTNIGAYAFEGCASLTNAIIANGVINIGASAFEDCSLLSSVTIAGSVISIGPFAFSACGSLTNATISDGVASIGDGAFNQCSSLSNVTIPASVAMIGEDAFNECYRLKTITVDAQNSIYSDVRGVLFDKSVTSVVAAPCGLDQSFDIPSSVTTIGEGAFSESGLTNVTIPGSVTNIGAYAFSGCHNLTSVTIPGSVTTIGEDAFLDCPFLASTYFTGDAPAADSTVFLDDNVPGFVTVYYLPGTSGWSSTFAGKPTTFWQLPYPVILNSGSHFGVQSNTFGFTISWATNISLVVQSSDDLANPVWTASTNVTLTNGSFFFSEPLQANNSGRFYRISAH